MLKFPCNKQGKPDILTMASYRKIPFLLNLATLFLTCFVISACGATASQPKAPPQASKTVPAKPTPTAMPITYGHLGVFIPAYWDNTSSNWNRLIKTHPQETTVIVNLNDGPVDNLEPDLARDITAAQKAGIKVIGYVWTGEADPTADAPLGQPEATVKQNIDIWYKYYKLNGILLDDVLYTQKNLPYFQDLYRYIKQKYGTDSMVYINGAAIPPADYAHVADVIQVYEGTLTANPSKNYQGYQSNYIQSNQATFNGWMSDPENATRFAAIVSNIHTAGEMETVIQTSIKAHIHYIDVIPTDQNYTNLPPYWEQFVAMVNNTLVPEAASQSIVKLSTY